MSVEALYLYCVARVSTQEGFGPIGIEGALVYALSHQGLCAVAHDCPARPYESSDEPTVRGWVAAHHQVVAMAWARFADILPCRFNTILKGAPSLDPRESLRRWLERESQGLLERLARVEGKEERGVQVFWDRPTIARQLKAREGPLRDIALKITSLPEGTAYLHRQKLERLLSQELGLEAEARFKEFYPQIRASVDDIQVGRAGEAQGGRRMIMNLSCLLRRGREAGLREVLEKIERKEGFSARSTGPWPPYSFS